MDDVKIYVFVHESITNCYECPFCYDYIACNLKSGVVLTDHEEIIRPFNCPLKEL